MDAPEQASANPFQMGAVDTCESAMTTLEGIVPQMHARMQIIPKASSPRGSGTNSEDVAELRRQLAELRDARDSVPRISRIRVATDADDAMIRERGDSDYGLGD